LRLNVGHVLSPWPMLVRQSCSRRLHAWASVTATVAITLAMAPSAIAMPSAARSDVTSESPRAEEPEPKPESEPELKPEPAPLGWSVDGEPRVSGRGAPTMVTPRGRPDMPAGEGRLARYLERPVRLGMHHVDHGVLQVAVAGGWPHLYRLELSLGLLDHLTLGVTTHWLPRQARPRFAPVIAVAFFRNHLFEAGVRHFWSLYPPPTVDADPSTPSYPGLAQWTLAHGSFGQAWVTGGFDAGVVRARVDDPGQDPDAMANNPSITTWRFGGGLHLRAGTRRFGVSAQVLVPQVFAELRLDVRFGLFERRTHGGWRPHGVVEDWDRPLPF